MVMAPVSIKSYGKWVLCSCWRRQASEKNAYILQVESSDITVVSRITWCATNKIEVASSGGSGIKRSNFKLPPVEVFSVYKKLLSEWPPVEV